MSSVIWGCDVSHHNRSENIPLNSAFIWIKATEGATYIDRAIGTHLQYIAKNMSKSLPIIGFYHFARPYNNDAFSEAKHYLDVISPHIGKCIMALDIEGVELEYTRVKEWCKNWLDYVRSHTGALPFIYTSASCTRTFRNIADMYPLWVAHYNTNTPKVDSRFNVFPLMWQYTSKPIDCDMFYGSVGQLASFARGN